MDRANELLLIAQQLELGQAQSWVAEWASKAKGDSQERLLTLLQILSRTESSLQTLRYEISTLQQQVNTDRARITAATEDARTSREEADSLRRSIEEAL
jgi:uncharacterized protein YlxW (UPF0749 family)